MNIKTKALHVCTVYVICMCSQGPLYLCMFGSVTCLAQEHAATLHRKHAIVGHRSIPPSCIGECDCVAQEHAAAWAGSHWVPVPGFVAWSCYAYTMTTVQKPGPGGLRSAPVLLPPPTHHQKPPSMLSSVVTQG